jgi:hypothetical protein
MEELFPGHGEPEVTEEAGVVVEVAREEGGGLRVLDRDGLRHVDHHGLPLEQERVERREVPMNEFRVPEHPADLFDQVGIDGGGIIDLGIAQPGGSAVRIPDKFHHEHIAEMAVRHRRADVGVDEATEDGMLPTGPGVHQAREIADARLAAELIDRVGGKVSERSVPDTVDLDRAELLAHGRPEHPTLLAGGDRVVEGIELTLGDESRDREKGPMVEEIVQEFPLRAVLAPVFEPLSPAGQNDLRRAGHDGVVLPDTLRLYAPSSRSRRPRIREDPPGGVRASEPISPLLRLDRTVTALLFSSGSTGDHAPPGGPAPPRPTLLGAVGDRLERPADFDAVFRVVRAAVRSVLGVERPGLGLGLSDLPPQLGAYWQVTGNLIVMNEGLVDAMRAHAKNPLELNSFLYVILAHEYLHSLGYLDERAVREVTARVTRTAFGPDHPATRMAEGDLWRMFPFLTEARGGRGSRLRVVPRFDLQSTDTYIR